MLAQTVRSNLKDINNLKMRTKATKFSKLFSTAPTVKNNEPEIRQFLAKDGLIEIKEDDAMFDEIIESETVKDDEISEYIVENPDEVIVEFPIISSVEPEEKLPFFKSISYKLANAS
ncbi:hypothetical protein IJ541_04235 [bacterium]|nr:hypothetical protein [bacterium]